MNTKRILIIGAAAISALLVGCAQPGLGGGNYTRSQVRGEQSVRLGTVESVRDVVIDARQDGTGTLIGAGLGGIAGSTVGGGNRANAAGAIAGAVVGAIAGSAIEKNANDRKGVEVTVRLEGGKLIAITQEKDEEFRVGDRVRILSGQGATRVSRL
ncbi:MAG TPA: glycine zipper 2TM domain-containing protein [Usitatibacteraceae bacterium]